MVTDNKGINHDFEEFKLQFNLPNCRAQEVESSRCKAVGYDNILGLIIVYKYGIAYTYPTMGLEDYKKLIKAASKGSWIQNNLINANVKYVKREYRKNAKKS